MKHESDEVIYARFLKDNSNEDLKELLSRHREGLTFFLYGFLHNMEDAEDIMLDSFAVAASGTSRFSGKSSFKTWLFSIGRNRAMKHLRKNRFKIQPIDEAKEIAHPSDTPEDAMIADERKRHLYSAMKELNPDYRHVLFLLYFEQMSTEEAAVVLKKSTKQIYNLSSRGRSALKQQLESMGFEYEKY